MSDRTRAAIRPTRRRFYLGLAAAMTAFAVAGFSITYWGPLFAGTLELHWFLHVHGAVFFLWLALLLLQVGLVYRGRTDLHRRVGAGVGIAWGLLVLFVGVSASFGRISPAVGTEFGTLEEFVQFLPVPLGDMVAFGLLFGAGVAWRRRPEAHKRLMVLATAALLPAAGGRFAGLVDSPLLQRTLVVGAPLVFAVLAMGYDRWTRGHVHRAYLWGTGLLAVVESRFFLLGSETWRGLSASIADALRGVLTPIL